MLSTRDLIIRNSLFTYNAVAVEELIANKAKSGLRDLDSENSRVTKILLNFQNSNKKHLQKGEWTLHPEEPI